MQLHLATLGGPHIHPSRGRQRSKFWKEAGRLQGSQASGPRAARVGPGGRRGASSGSAVSLGEQVGPCSCRRKPWKQPENHSVFSGELPKTGEARLRVVSTSGPTPHAGPSPLAGGVALAPRGAVTPGHTSADPYTQPVLTPPAGLAVSACLTLNSPAFSGG